MCICKCASTYICVINNLFQFQRTNYMVSPLKKSLLSLMYFPILLCYMSMHFWKDSSGMKSHTDQECSPQQGTAVCSGHE